MYDYNEPEELTVDAILEAAEALQRSSDVNTSHAHPMVFFGLNVLTLADATMNLETIAFDLPDAQYWHEEVAHEFVGFYNYLQASSISFRPDPLDAKKLLISR